MKSLSGQIRQFIALIITLGIVLLALCLYFFVYVSGKEAQVKERNFRVLSRTAQNLSTKVEEYSSKRMAKNLVVGSIHQLVSGKSTEGTPCDGKNDKGACFIKLLERSTKGISIDTLVLQYASQTGISSHQERVVEGSSRWRIRFEDIFDDTFHTRKISKLVTAGMLDAPDKDRSNELKVYAYTSMPVDAFIKPLLRNDLFDDYVIFEPRPGDKTRADRHVVIYATNQLGISDSVTNKIIRNQNKVALVELNGVTYLAFNYPLTFAGKKWLLAGLQKKDDYSAETRSLDRPLLYKLVLVLLLLLMALPMIKVIFISRNEKLNRSDVIFCALSLFLGCCFCTFIIINLDSEHLYDHNELEELAVKIERSFETDIQHAYNTLEGADFIMTNRQEDRVMENEFVREICMCPTRRNCPPVTDKSLINLHWTDASGMQRYKWTNGKLTDKIDVNDRGYYRNFKDNKAWIYPFNPGQSPEYVVESILSWTELEKKAVVSKRSSAGDMEVVGITKKLRSVIEPILPHGFKFCLTDQQGNVWFHSDVRRNLNENIFDELQVRGKPPEIFFRSGFSGTCTYENKQHSLKVSAMRNFPLYLVVMKDLSFDQQSQAYAQEITFALIGLLAFVVLLAIVLIKVVHRQAIKRLCLDWLKPDVSKSEMYVKIAMVSLSIGIVFVALVLLNIFSQLEQIHFLLTLPLCTLPMFFFYLNVPTYRNYYSVPTGWVILVAAGVMVILDIFFAIAVKVPWVSFIGQVIILAAGILFLNRPLKLKRGSVRKFINSESNVLFCYAPALALLLTIIAIIPTVVFYRQAANYGRMVHTMMVQSEFTKQFYAPTGARKELLQEQYLVDMRKDTVAAGFTSLKDDFYFTRFSTFASAMTTKQPLNLLKHDEPGDTDYQIYIGNQKWIWKVSGDTSLHFTPEINDPYKQTYGVTSTLSRFTLYNARIWTFAFAAILYLVFLIYILCSRIYLFKANANIIEADYDLLRRKIDPVRISSSLHGQVIGNATTSAGKQEVVSQSFYSVHNHLFLIGLPFAGKKIFLDQIAPPEASKRYSIDLADDLTDDQIRNLPGAVKEYPMIIVDHFEYSVEDPVRNMRKLELLEALFQIPNKKIVLISTMHPTKLFEACPDMELKAGARWHAVLSNFYKIICPLLSDLRIEYAEEEQATINKVRSQRSQLAEFIDAECNHGLYLFNLRITLYNIAALEKNITIEELIVKLKSLAFNYYVSLWNCCTLEEQYLIYDLAEDGVVNGKNVESITRLIYKGIFIRDNSLSMMNASFRDFVLSHINPNEALALREKVSKNGNWSKMRLSLFFMLAIVAFFLLYSQRGLSSQIMGFITALAAALPLVFKILEAISNSAAKK